MLRITILAARRVLPPLLMTPAKASYPFMNDTGPEAVPPPARSTFAERMGDRYEQVLELGLERLGVGLGVEVALAAAPGADRTDDAADELPDAALALGGAEGAAEVLRGDDVGGGLRPELGDLDVLLLEDDLALLARNDRGAGFPPHPPGPGGP